MRDDASRMDLSRSMVVTILLSSIGIGAGSLAAEVLPGAVAVSPGGLERSSRITDATPTFSWGAVIGASGYEVLVYETSSEALVANSEPTIHQRIPAAALSWTPDGAQRFEPGQTYAWTVRPLGSGKSFEWSSPRFFEISVVPVHEGMPSVEEIEDALAVLNRYLEARRAEAVRGPVDEYTPEVISAQVAVSDVESPKEMQVSSSRADSLEPDIPGVLPLTATEFAAHTDFLAGQEVSATARFRVFAQETFDGYTYAAYLGVAEGTNNFDGFESLDIPGEEIGILGLAVDAAGADNYGIVGFSDGHGGRFLHHSSSNEVLLAGPTTAITATGDITASGEVTWTCPAGMERKGAWCIDTSINSASSAAGSLLTCHNESKMLCPLEALMTCDQTGSGVGNDCKSRTGGSGSPFRVFGIWTDPDGSGLDRANPYNQTLEWDPSPNGTGAPVPQIRPVSGATSLPYFCCKPVSAP